jgi:phosphosulfolactate phosphohydrolase-like enzyme
MAAFVNVRAVARVAAASRRRVLVVAMGCEATESACEDLLCGALLLHALGSGPAVAMRNIDALRMGPGAAFVDDDGGEYPRRDFSLCTAVNRFDFAVVVKASQHEVMLQRLTG